MRRLLNDAEFQFCLQVRDRFGLRAQELMETVLTRQRWEILRALCGAGPVTFREAAEIVGRDVNDVQADLTALSKAGIVEREADGVLFPYETIQVEL